MPALFVLAAIAAFPAFARDLDLLIADFESDSYDPWTTTGQAFGPGPARGTLPNQMHVSGHHGQRLVNTFFGGDGATGTLTSPPFTIERDYIGFLIGGGGYEGTTCMNLLLDGRVVRSAVGPNTIPGGSERLETQFWDVRDLKGKSATIQIVDDATGGWGHVNVDHIVQTDTKPDIPVFAAQERAFTVEEPYLIIPIKNGVPPTRLVLEVDGQPVRDYTAELATRPDDVDWYAFLTIDTYKNQSAVLRAARATDEASALVRQSDTVPGSDTWYTEPLRPQVHFSQAVGWINDPNGLVYLDGEWHLFFQHNPVGWAWGNMTWGHAVSSDLVHWKQLPNALFPKTMAVGDCFSGGGLVDARNTAGWKTGPDDVLVVFCTDTGAGESVAYSNDHGRTFTWYEGNPVVRHTGRDPKVFWYTYAPLDTPLNDTARAMGGHWVMAVYDESDTLGQNIAFYTSLDLKNWTEQSHLPGFFECPEVLPLPIDNDKRNLQWVAFAADAKYALGSFDGRTFTPAHEGKHQLHFGPYYASQVFSDAPSNRRIQIGWLRIDAPGMPFNQFFSFPQELTLRITPDGPRLFAEPVHEITTLHGPAHKLGPRRIAPDSPAALHPAGQIFDIEATIELGDATRVSLVIQGQPIDYDVAAATLAGAPLAPLDGLITIRAVVDRATIEVTGNDGAVSIVIPRTQPLPAAPSPITLTTTEGHAHLVSLTIHELASIWPPKD